jgi:hypothetical protein
MAAKVVSLRLDEELLEWATDYARTRGVSRTDLLVEGLQSFREDCVAGVPEIRERARALSTVPTPPLDGVGVCPAREDGLGHVWRSPREDVMRPCVFGCGVNGREPEVQGRDSQGHLAEAGASRAEAFGAMRVPMENGTGKEEKAWPKGRSPERAERIARVQADIARADRDHPWVEGPDGKLVRS